MKNNEVETCIMTCFVVFLLFLQNAQFQRPVLVLRNDQHPYAWAFSPNGKYLAVIDCKVTDGWCSDFRLILWNLSDKSQKVIYESTCELHALAISPDGKHMALSGHQQLVIWDLPSCKERYAIRGQNEFGRMSRDFPSIVFSSKRNALIVGECHWRGRLEYKNSVYFLDLRNWEKDVVFERTEELTELGRAVVSSDETLIACKVWKTSDGLWSSGTAYFSLWDVPKKRTLGSVKAPSDARLLQLSPEGKAVIANDSAAEIIWWDIQKGTKEKTLAVDEPLSTRFMSPRHMFYLCRSENGTKTTFEFLDLLTKRKIPVVTTRGWGAGFALSPDGSLLAGGVSPEDEGPMEIRIWDISHAKMREARSKDSIKAK